MSRVSKQKDIGETKCWHFNMCSCVFVHVSESSVFYLCFICHVSSHLFHVFWPPNIWPTSWRHWGHHITLAKICLGRDGHFSLLPKKGGKTAKKQTPAQVDLFFFAYIYIYIHIYIYPRILFSVFNNPRMLQDFVYQPVWPCNQHVSGARFLVRSVSKIRNHCLHSGQLCRVASRCGVKNGIQNVLANFNGYIQTTRLNSCHQTVSTVVDNYIASWVALLLFSPCIHDNPFVLSRIPSVDGWNLHPLRGNVTSHYSLGHTYRGDIGSAVNSSHQPANQQLANQQKLQISALKLLKKYPKSDWLYKRIPKFNKKKSWSSTSSKLQKILLNI